MRKIVYTTSILLLLVIIISCNSNEHESTSSQKDLAEHDLYNAFNSLIDSELIHRKNLLLIKESCVTYKTMWGEEYLYTSKSSTIPPPNVLYVNKDYLKSLIEKNILTASQMYSIYNAVDSSKRFIFDSNKLKIKKTSIRNLINLRNKEKLNKFEIFDRIYKEYNSNTIVSISYPTLSSDHKKMLVSMSTNNEKDSFMWTYILEKNNESWLILDKTMNWSY